MPEQLFFGAAATEAARARTDVMLENFILALALAQAQVGSIDETKTRGDEMGADGIWEPWLEIYIYLLSTLHHSVFFSFNFFFSHLSDEVPR